MRCAPVRRLCTRLGTAFAAVFIAAAAAASPLATDANNLGIEAYNRGAFTEAIRQFERAYNTVPHNATVRRNLCNAYQAHANNLAQQADYQRAVHFLELAIGADPENVSPLVQLGAYYLRLDMVPEAVFRLEEAIELTPGHLKAHELLGEAYYRDNDLPSARAQWEYVLQMQPERADLRERYDKAFREEGVEGNFRQRESRHFKFSFTQAASPSLKNRLVGILERAYTEVGRQLGNVYPPGPIAVIVYGQGEFEEATQVREHVGALYDGKIRLPITDPNGQLLDEEELRRRATHEYVHVVMRYMAGNNIPWWLNEGLAEALSGDVGPIKRQVLRRAYEGGTDFALAQLAPNQLQALDADPLRLAYVQSHATVELLLQRFGRHSLVRLLDALATGEDPESAFRAVYHRTYEMLEAEVAAVYF